MNKDKTWHAGIGLVLGHIVLEMGTQLPLPQRGTAPPQFSAHICYGQVAGWIKMPLGRKVGLDTSDIVLDGDSAPLPQKVNKAPPHSFWPMPLVAKRVDG